MKASLFWVEIVCVDCSAHCYGQWVSGYKIPVNLFIKEAKIRGYSKLTTGDFRCPSCTDGILMRCGIKTRKGLLND